MANSKIAKNKIPELLKAVSADYAVYGPKSDDGVIAFGTIESGDDLVLDYRNSTVSAKELFLPRVEVVYEFDGENFVNEVLPDQKRVVFGMCPCDCRALTLLDHVFDTDDIKDPFYISRRENTVVIALGCNEPSNSCFCTVVGGEPFGEDGADIMMADMGDSLLAKSITPKGKDFLAKFSKFFASGSGNWDKQAKAAKDKIKSKLNVKDAKACLDERFENDIWEMVAKQCLGCGACSYLCPSCYCFDLVDEKTSAGGMKKIRKWDCCMFPLFTKHVSGHNPRSINASRMRQKVMHKFSYYPERYDLNGCVGCGRCVRSCPVNLDIRQILANVTTAPNTITEE